MTFAGDAVSLSDWIFNLVGVDADRITVTETSDAQHHTDVINGVRFEAAVCHCCSCANGVTKTSHGNCSSRSATARLRPAGA